VTNVLEGVADTSKREGLRAPARTRRLCGEALAAGSTDPLSDFVLLCAEASRCWLPQTGLLRAWFSAAQAHDAWHVLTEQLQVATQESVGRRALGNQEREEDPLASSEASTAPEARPHSLDEALRSAFLRGREETFEDGMESRFSAELKGLIRQHGDLAIEAASYLVHSGWPNAEVASEALRWFGRMRDPRTHEYRRWVLEKSLESPSAAVRDGGLIGLESLGDPRSIPSVRNALGREVRPELLRDMERLLRQLEEADLVSPPPQGTQE
jgi:hypothetical protein